MPTPPAILTNVRRLMRNIRAGTVPALDELQDLCADWATIMGDLDDEALTAAVTGYLRGDCPFWPTPGQVLALAPARRLAVIDDAPEAWAHTRAWLSGNRYADPAPGALDPKNPKRDAAMVAALREIGGARAYGQSQESEEQWIAKRFKESYAAHRKRGTLTVELRQLTGASPARRIGGSGFQPLFGVDE